MGKSFKLLADGRSKGQDIQISWAHKHVTMYVGCPAIIHKARLVWKRRLRA